MALRRWNCPNSAYFLLQTSGSNFFVSEPDAEAATIILPRLGILPCQSAERRFLILWPCRDCYGTSSVPQSNGDIMCIRLTCQSYYRKNEISHLCETKLYLTLLQHLTSQHVRDSTFVILETINFLLVPRKI